MKRVPRRLWIALIGLVWILIGAACATIEPRNSVPEALTRKAVLPGLSHVRYWGGMEDPHYRESLQSMLQQRIAQEGVSEAGQLEPMPILVLSGGGPHGAFGSGILNGWTENGTRPEFAAVTGVSTGALIAPFAFLGSEFDSHLTETYTNIRTENIMERLSIFKIMSADSISSDFPLWQLIQNEYSEELMKKIGEEHNQGRRLFVSSTDLDAQIGVIWDLGAIASSGHPDALTIFRKALLASASIPVAFPPVYFDVEVDGIPYEEMHVDGGLAHQLFLFGGVLSRDFWERTPHEFEDLPAMPIYVIKNGYISGRHSEVERRLMPIFMKTINTLTTAQGLGDILRVHSYTKEMGSDFRFIHLPESVKDQSTEFFDPVEMRRLYEIGYTIASDPEFWETVPPAY